MTYGSAAASYWVEEFGCERAQRLTRDEIEERYEAFRRMTSVEGVPANVRGGAARRPPLAQCRR